MLVECINDKGYHESAFKYIKEFPIKGVIYELRGRKHTLNGLGYLLHEITNPIMPNGVEPSFSAKRFATLLNDLDTVQEKELTNEH